MLSIFHQVVLLINKLIQGIYFILTGIKEVLFVNFLVICAFFSSYLGLMRR